MNLLIFTALFNLCKMIKNRSKNRNYILKTPFNSVNLFTNRVADEVLRNFSLEIGKTLEKLASNNNEVYKLTFENKSYILKKFLNEDFSDENKIALSINFPKVKEVGNDFRLENFVEHEKIDYQIDLEKIAKSILDFHNLKFNSKNNSSFRNYLTILNNQYDIQMKYLSFLDNQPDSVKNLYPFDLKNLILYSVLYIIGFWNLLKKIT